MPEITVIVPFYQTDKGLFDRCINSILEDKDADVELLIIDDGSPEVHYSTTDAFLSDSRVKVFHNAHKGVSAARNFGIENASGTWVMFADSDDFLERGWYSELKPYLDNAEDVLFFSGFGDSRGVAKKNQCFLKEGVDYGSREELRLQLMESAFTIGLLPKGYLSYYSLGAPYSKLIKTAFLKENGIRYDKKITFAEDTLFALDVLLKARSILYTDKYLYHYVSNGSSVTRRFRPGLSAEMIRFFDAANSFFAVNKLEERMKSAYLNRVFHEMNRAIRLEFFHKDNPKSLREKHQEVNRLVANEPFSSALKRGARGEYGAVERVEAILIRSGMYSLMINTRALLLRSRKITSIVLAGRAARR